MNLVNLVLKPIKALVCKKYALVKSTLFLVCGVFVINIIEDLTYKYERQHSTAERLDFGLYDHKRPHFAEQNPWNSSNRTQEVETQDRMRNDSTNGIKEVITKFPVNNDLVCRTRFSLDSLHYICRPSRHFPAQITLFTTISNISAENFFIINNTLTVWSDLAPAVRPVLFVLYTKRNRHNHLLKTLTRAACSLGWIVVQCPHCRDGLPVLGSLFQTVYAMGGTTWYGYSQNHVLFDPSLAIALDKLQFYIKRIRPYGLLAGSQYSIKLSAGKNFADHTALKSLTFNATKDQEGTAAYIITKQWGYPWSKLPPLVIGEPDLETFYLWYSIYYKPVFNMDVTDVILALGQETEGTITALQHPPGSDDSNKTQSNSTDNRYHITKAFPDFESYLRSQEYLPSRGVTKCLQYKLGYIRSPYARVFRRWVTYGKDLPQPCKVNKYTLVDTDDDAMDTIDIQLAG